MLNQTSTLGKVRAGAEDLSAVAELHRAKALGSANPAGIAGSSPPVPTWSLASCVECLGRRIGTEWYS